MKEKKARVEDAMHATRAAVEEGIVPGGGVALVRATAGCRRLVKTLEGDEKIGAQIVRRAIEEPLRQIVANAGEEGAVVVGKIHESKDPNFGYNAATGEYEDLVKAGVIDPTKVTRTALQNAASIAGLMLTTEAMVVGHPREEVGSRRRRPRRRHGRHVLVLRGRRNATSRSPTAVQPELSVRFKQKPLRASEGLFGGSHLVSRIASLGRTTQWVCCVFHPYLGSIPAQSQLH